MPIAKRVNEGCEYPTGYGFAYRDWMRNQAVCYPLGLNWLVGLLHKAHMVLAHGIFRDPDAISLQLIHANIAGQSRGIEIEREYTASRLARAKADGFRDGWRQAFERMEQQLPVPR